MATATWASFGASMLREALWVSACHEVFLVLCLLATILLAPVSYTVVSACRVAARHSQFRVCHYVQFPFCSLECSAASCILLFLYLFLGPNLHCMSACTSVHVCVCLSVCVCACSQWQHGGYRRPVIGAADNRRLSGAAGDCGSPEEAHAQRFGQTCRANAACCPW